MDGSPSLAITKGEKNTRILFIVLSVTAILAIVITIVIGAYFILTKKSATAVANNKNKPAITEPPENKVAAISSGLPFTIGSSDRLIIKASKSDNFQSTYFIYKYPVGTYNTLSDLVNALNIQNGFEAIFFDSTNRIWAVNALLTWGQNMGKLNFTWTDTYFNRIIFYKGPPFNDPLFGLSSGQSGINDSIVQPNFAKFIDNFGIRTDLIYNTGETITLNFP
jgi:hypothetical protein